ncbi:MAG: hypothetical protein OXG33_09960 [Chloroflexi bacterium]|nr:hypothetical protein [Chloroflexota bacterium]
MIVDPAVIPGLLLLAAELAALAAVGYVIARVALRQDDERMALAQGLVVGPALWGVITNLVLYVVPGLAGAAVAWGVMVAVGAVVVWRGRRPLRLRPRTVAGFTVAALALFWVALASRQVLAIPDPTVQLGLAVSIRAGGFPPELFWNPGAPAPYHHGIPLLVGLLAPPAGPGLGLVTELLGAYVWMSFALVIATLLLHRASSFAAAVTAPLLITAGAWTFTWVGEGLLEIPVLAGVPSAEAGASLMDIYWPSPEQSWLADRPIQFREAALPDIWKPGFPLGHALLVIVLERSARAKGRSWPFTLTQAALVSFVGLSVATLAPLLLALWAGLEAVHLRRARCAQSLTRGAVLRSTAGLALAVVLLLAGGRFAGFLSGAASVGLTLAWNEHGEGWRLLGAFDPRSGGIAVLGVGPVVVAGAAALMARHDRLVQALALGSGVLALAYLGLRYTPAPFDVDRLAGHGRNLALIALLLALSVRLTGLPPRLRYAASGVLVVLLIWPTVVGPARSLGLALGHGPLLADAQPGQRTLSGSAAFGRSLRVGPISERVAAYIRDHTAVDAHVLDTAWPFWHVQFNTGRPNNAGFYGLTHQFFHVGPEYWDALKYLEPAAIRRLGIQYVRATDAWVAGLPSRAQAWLGDPRFFELLVRDGGERLFRVRPAFPSLDVSPHPASFEALRQAVPPSATVYLVIPPRDVQTLRVASTLSHARLVGQVDTHELHLLTPTNWSIDPLTDETPDIVVLPSNGETWMFPPSARTPIWWTDHNVAVYAPTGAVPQILDTPMPDAAGPPRDLPPVLLEVRDVTVADGRIEFAAAFNERTSQGWTSQDWIILEGDRSPWAIPTEVFRRRAEPTIAKWFAGLLSAGSATTSHTYRFDARARELSVRNDRGDFVPLASSADDLGPGGYTLALRLRHEYEPTTWRDAAVIPLLRIRISESGRVTYEPLADVRGAPVA